MFYILLVGSQPHSPSLTGRHARKCRGDTFDSSLSTNCTTGLYHRLQNSEKASPEAVAFKLRPEKYLVSSTRKEMERLFLVEIIL